MLPRATHTRSDREAARGKQSGRTQEIQRLIGRACARVSTRARSASARITLDCDVLQADGGTRTAAITGAYVAAARRGRAGCWRKGKHRARRRSATRSPRCRSASSQGTPVLDLDYAEDSACDTDMNVVMTGARRLRRGAGHRRRRAVLARARWTRCSRWPTRASRELVAAQQRGARRARDGDAAGAGVEQRRQAGRAARAARAAGRSSWSRRARSASPRPTSRTRTFVENALAKARHAARHAGGAGARRRLGPVRRRARRRAGRAFGALRALARTPATTARRSVGARTRPTTRCCSSACAAPADRRARFVCTLVALRRADDPEPLIADGRWHGEIAATRRAASGGFGYDPLMFDADARLHRGRARCRDAKNAHQPPRHALRAQMRALMRERDGAWRRLMSRAS